MTLKDINKQLAHLNPYTQKAEIRELLKARRKLLKVETLKPQEGV